MSESTGMFDKNGDEIFVGDTVEHCWGWNPEAGAVIRKHVITKYREGNRMAYHLGECHNTWEGKDVELVKE